MRRGLDDGYDEFFVGVIGQAVGVANRVLGDHAAAAPAETTTTRAAPSGVTSTPTPGSEDATLTRAPSAQLTESGSGSGDNFGSVVAMSGDVAVVGAPAQEGGRAYLFAVTAAGWKQVAMLRGSDTATADDFGLSIAIAGSTVAVGAPAHAGGRVYLFTDTAGGWRQSAELKGSDTSASDRFGTTVALSGSNLVVSAPGQASSAGRVYVFAETPSGWRQSAQLEGADTTPNDQFGAAVAISGPNLVVSAPFHAASNQAIAYGAVYVFTQTATGWRQRDELLSNENAYGEGIFGTNVAISATTMVVVAENQNPRESVYARHQGSAFIFAEAGNAWHQEAELSVPDFGGSFAGAVALSGTRAVVAHGSAGMAGGAYLFAKTASGWKLAAYLNGSNGNLIASSVAITATRVLVGDTSGVFVFDT
jgi:hypothetical protein